MSTAGKDEGKIGAKSSIGLIQCKRSHNWKQKYTDPTASTTTSTAIKQSVKITESEYDNSMDQVISKLKTLFDDIDQLKMDMLHLHDENKLNNNAITSIKMNMNAVNEKDEDQERE